MRVQSVLVPWVMSYMRVAEPPGGTQEAQPKVWTLGFWFWLCMIGGCSLKPADHSTHQRNGYDNSSLP